ncbi:HrpE/YscL family type III secretion apparatus protein [Trinickia diaoshuihuensis]|jgi:flagellar biosynthesis/type III secretory pathway protein FliH|uniref:HrpE/YscL family type III secretion apparatus protein n=1 Tax=Trinickia diaoshuihuensis TaxID=2292265 RepID=UPI000E284CF9|nr:HrpE/YscL family type III secretion apparatus protein [Trinickia diaoshuihuensis]
MSFTARRVGLGGGQTNVSECLVVRAQDAVRLRDVESIIGRARRTASSIVKQALAKEKIRRARSAEKRRARDQEADRAFAMRAAALEEAYEAARRALTSELEATLDQVLASVLANIGAEIPAAQRLRVVCEQLNKMAGPMSAARLCLCEEDDSTRRTAGLHCPWPIQIDAALSPGQCRLLTENGHWALDFDALFASLSAAASAGAPN